ncbi:MAG: AGE family epimerase/isomerase [Planctomycetota bacterium]|nr:AGE family epimerase/isomerase [Planctomycetota bacterium]
MNTNIPLLIALLLAIGCTHTKPSPTTQQSEESPLTPPPTPATQPAPADYTRIADEIESALNRDVVRAFFPACIDHTFGGFHSAFNRDWSRAPSQGKGIVYQSRQTWIASQLALQRPQLRDEFLAITRHGLKFLKNTMWDKSYGGFYWQLNDDGSLPQRPQASEKLLYGESFGIYASASAYLATRDPDALELALLAFQWLDQHAHDPKNGGYFEVLARDGSPIRTQTPPTPSSRFHNSGFHYNYKSQNSHIHILEALTTLYTASKDPKVRVRLEEIFLIVRDRIVVPPGCLNLFFTPDWRPVPDHDSYGHDIETAFLLLEASESLSPPRPLNSSTLEPLNSDAKTLAIARMLVDHTLDWGFDNQIGGVYDRGFALAPAFDKKKTWWTQVEALNSLLLMHEHFGHQSDRYWQAFLKQWNYIKNHQIDPQFPGFFADTEPDGKPLPGQKSQNWKAAYHDGRAFLQTTARLRHLASTPPH